MTIEEFFQTVPKAAMGFSGGVDSAYLLYAAAKSGTDIGAYYIKTAFQPDFELADARQIADQLGVELRIIELDVLARPEITANPPDRCYHCKRALFGALIRQAAADGYDLILDGTNASDDIDDRPGFRALQEMRVRSPLRECGLTKAEIRRRSKEAGLFTWNKPSYACLATRVLEPLTQDNLQRADRAEAIVRSFGFTDFRVRTQNNHALVQIGTSGLEDARARWTDIHAALSPLFPNGTELDRAGRIEEVF